MRWVVVACLSFGCARNAETCVGYRLSYSGTAQGTVLVVETDRDPSGAVAGSSGQVFPSVPLALAANRVTTSGASGSNVCWGSSIEKDLTADVTAWIDVSGKYPNGWVEGAAPQPGDPAGHTVVAIRDFESNLIDVSIRDP